MRKISESRKRKWAEADIQRRNRPKKESAKQEDNDRISKLPDEILISIISRLSLKEATSTTILSTRWRHLHTYTSRLDFPPFQPQHNLQEIEQHTRFRNHVNMINGVLDSHRGGRRVKELKLDIMYNLKGAYREFEKWIEFALSREIEIIDIKMLGFSLSSNISYSNLYSLGLSKLVSSTNSGHPLPAFKFLNQLCLHSVDVNDQDFEFLISKFLALETLSIQNSHELTNVSIVGHPKLKHLDLCFDYRLQTFEVREVMKLVSLRCFNLPKSCVVNFENVPKLVHFISDGSFFLLLSCIPDQVQTLHLTLDFSVLDELELELFPFDLDDDFEYMEPVVLPFQFANLKHLELDVEWKDDTFHDLMLYSFIQACLSLQKLKIKFLWLGKKDDEIYEEGEARKLPSEKKFNPNLKEVEFIGFLGYRAQLTISQFVIDHVEGLEKLRVVVSDERQSIREVALTRAHRHFKKITPPSANLQII